MLTIIAFFIFLVHSTDLYCKIWWQRLNFLQEQGSFIIVKKFLLGNWKERTCLYCVSGIALGFSVCILYILSLLLQRYISWFLNSIFLCNDLENIMSVLINFAMTLYWLMKFDVLNNYPLNYTSYIDLCFQHEVWQCVKYKWYFNNSLLRLCNDCCFPKPQMRKNLHVQEGQYHVLNLNFHCICVNKTEYICRLYSAEICD